MADTLKGLREELDALVDEYNSLTDEYTGMREDTSDEANTRKAEILDRTKANKEERSEKQAEIEMMEEKDRLSTHRRNGDSTERVEEEIRTDGRVEFKQTRDANTLRYDESSGDQHSYTQILNELERQVGMEKRVEIPRLVKDLLGARAATDNIVTQSLFADSTDSKSVTEPTVIPGTVPTGELMQDISLLDTIDIEIVGDVEFRWSQYKNFDGATSLAGAEDGVIPQSAVGIENRHDLTVPYGTKFYSTRDAMNTGDFESDLRNAGVRHWRQSANIDLLTGSGAANNIRGLQAGFAEQNGTAAATGTDGHGAGIRPNATPTGSNTPRLIIGSSDTFGTKAKEVVAELVRGRTFINGPGYGGDSIGYAGPANLYMVGLNNLALMQGATDSQGRPVFADLLAANGITNIIAAPVFDQAIPAPANAATVHGLVANTAAMRIYMYRPPTLRQFTDVEKYGDGRVVTVIEGRWQNALRQTAGVYLVRAVNA